MPTGDAFVVRAFAHEPTDDPPQERGVGPVDLCEIECRRHGRLRVICVIPRHRQRQG